MTPAGRIFRRDDEAAPQLEASDPVAAWAADFRARARGEKPAPPEDEQDDNHQ